MNHIYIEHNPFEITTLFRINDMEPSQSSSLVSYANKRLQLWVENIFFDLKEQFNGDASFAVEFTGLETDFNDISEAAEQASLSGMKIELQWNEVESAQSRLSKIKEMMVRVEKSPKFAEYLQNGGEEVKKNFEEALDNNFDVYVVATMSSGKSTFINALLGRDLLPAANEATTATIAQVFDDKTLGDVFIGERDGKVSIDSPKVDLDTLTAWNSDPETKKIELLGNIRAVEPNDNVRLVLTDTPGPNNSQDEEHERTTMGFVQDSQRNPLIIYVLNATQLATNDDQNLLRLVSEIMKKGGKQSKDRFLFVINKMDMFDPEKGESIERALGNVKKYLNANGIEDPNLYPVSARIAYLLRKHGELTRTERGDKRNIEELLLEEPSMEFPQYMTLSSSAKDLMERKSNSNRTLRNSGVPAVEAVIDEYINKYSFPTRLNRAHLALSKTIEQGLKEEELKSQLDLGQKELESLAIEIEQLKERREQGFSTEAYKENILRTGRDLPAAVQDKLTEMEQLISMRITEIGSDFVGDVTPQSAENRLKMAIRDVEFSFKKVVNEYEQAFQNSQEIIKKELHDEYMEHISSLFPESRGLELPIFKSLRDSISTISLNIGLQNDDIGTRKVVVGSKTVKDSKWYNPFSWGRTKEVKIYDDEEFVDLQELWKERVTVIRSEFMKLREVAVGRIKEDKDKLLSSYLYFIETEFESKFTSLLDDLSKNVADKEQREKAIEQAKHDLEQIGKLKEDLEHILAL
ncbi:50S ribosome-binding GTPase [Vibrio sp. 10N.286.49.B3]|uniref:dynamin family protein n=1 Tax=Vibrio sp. 10N.286.49.B3 TaxID=1880855 RepID=UPI000C845319|nr:dynamin family protein [Vibrio sp. 10N.286.49.B3]PMH44657.1 50S ribosome-binding GTPase [Vibrio sp. 10N.286.49.B3]